MIVLGARFPSVDHVLGVEEDVETRGISPWVTNYCSMDFGINMTITCIFGVT